MAWPTTTLLPQESFVKVVHPLGVRGFIPYVSDYDEGYTAGYAVGFVDGGGGGGGSPPTTGQLWPRRG